MKRIKQISVKNLFGMFDHIISLNLDERITIMHGPNGFGKTATLRLLDSLFSQDNSTLQDIPFDEFRVDFVDDTGFWVIKTVVMPDKHERWYPIARKKQQNITLQFFASSQEEVIATLFIPPSESYAEDFSPLKISSLEDRIENIRKIKYKALIELRQCASLRLIETQRLQSTRTILTGETFEDYEEESIVEPTVLTYSLELAQIIRAKLAESTTLTQSLDRTFPARLVNPIIKKRDITEEEIRNRLEELEKKRQYLTAVGLLDQGDTDAIQVQEQDQIDDNTTFVLSVYAEDTEKKLGVFDELANKIDLLKRIINKRFLYKEMTISKDEGFVFTNSKGVVLSPNELSSGEQHELILFYELLFKVAPGSLILIDEPEISLHVVWQEQFLEDVQAVTRLSDIDVLIATHSPDIIAGRRDLMVELKGPV